MIASGQALPGMSGGYQIGMNPNDQKQLPQQYVNVGGTPTVQPGVGIADPNTWNIGNLTRTTTGQQNAAFAPALGAYRQALGSAGNYAQDLQKRAFNTQVDTGPGRFAGGVPQMQMAGQFQGQNFTPNFRGQDFGFQQFNPGQLYSNRLDPLLQQQMAQAQQTNALQSRSIANQVAQAAGGNQALAGAMRGRMLQQSMLAQNSIPTQFAAQQAERDIQARSAAERGYGLNLQGQGQSADITRQNYLARLQGQQAGAENLRQNYMTGLAGTEQGNKALESMANIQRQNYGANLDYMNALNTARTQNLGALTAAASPVMNYFNVLGEQLPAFGTQTQSGSATNIGRQVEQGGGK